MIRHLCLRVFLQSLAFASLLFIPLHRPGLLASTLLHVTVCASVLGLAFLLIAYRREVRALIAAASRAWAVIVVALLPAPRPVPLPIFAPRRSTDPARAPLFQRPPPLCA
ncbi:MAG TPA: hypothetical protein VHX37_14235 [Acidobacteriaceae bacterium]|nr:hypothetical protein [Acidobacteriaceae bacterium]